VYHPQATSFMASDSIIAGNAALYGATAGSAFMAGTAAERFAVRNSGATAVVEGVGDHGCEYMTNGLVIVLGTIGHNFAAGMSGGKAYVLDLHASLCNTESILLETICPEESDSQTVNELLQEHLRLTGSIKAKDLLACDWAVSLARFTRIFPKDYKKALAATQAKEKAACESKQLPQKMSEGETRSVQRSTTMDMEDLRKPHSVEKPIKKRGFHEYSRKAMSYRTPGDRALD